MTDIVRSTGYNFVRLKQAVFGVVAGRFTNPPVSADAIAQWVISANDYVDSRLCFTMGKIETVTVADQGNYTVWDSPVLIRDVTCDGKVLAEISFHEYLVRQSTTTSETVVKYYARFGAELYLWPNPPESGQAIVVYIHQSPYVDFTSAHPYPTEDWADLSLDETKKLITTWIQESHDVVGKPFFMGEFQVHNVDRVEWWTEIYAAIEEAGGDGSAFWWYADREIDGKHGVTESDPELDVFREHSARMAAKSGA